MERLARVITDRAVGLAASRKQVNTNSGNGFGAQTIEDRPVNFFLHVQQPDPDLPHDSPDWSFMESAKGQRLFARYFPPIA